MTDDTPREPSWLDQPYDGPPVTLAVRPLGLRVRDVREYRGLDYRAASAEIGLSVGQLHRLENDPTLDPLSSTVERVERWLAQHQGAPLAEDRLPEPFPLDDQRHHRIIQIPPGIAAVDIPTLAGPGDVLVVASDPDDYLEPRRSLWVVRIVEDDWDYDRFESCVVWAVDAAEAEQLVRAAPRYTPEQLAELAPLDADRPWIESPEWRLEVTPAPTAGIPLVHWHAG